MPQVSPPINTLLYTLILKDRKTPIDKDYKDSYNLLNV